MDLVTQSLEMMELKLLNFFILLIFLNKNILLKEKYYSSEGEDLTKKNLKKRFLLDEAYPIRHNNTMILYQNGWRGISNIC